MTPSPPELEGILTFLRRAESLKEMTRVAWTTGGQQESVAAHTWRMSLMAMVLARHLPGLDVGRLLSMCLVHDLGEAIHGDVSAALQAAMPDKAAQERRDLLDLTTSLPPEDRDAIVALWDEYEAAETLEARVAKGIDKLETILQHNQGAMPSGFDFRFNLEYGARYTQDEPVLQALRAILDEETERRAREADVREAGGPPDEGA